MPELRQLLPATTVSIARAATGLVLSLVGPVGWLALRWLQGVPPRVEVRAHLGLYAYLLVSTGVFVTAFGYALGRVEEQLRRANERLLELSMTDDLTGLVNTRVLHDELPRLASLARRSGLKLSVVLLDLDHFKRVNDTRGHPAGDAVLRTVGRLLRACSRREDVVARIGGEEFAVVLPGIDTAGARSAAERLLAALRQVRIESHPDLRITASAGVAVMQSGEGPDELVARADVALYDAKRLGRDRVEMAAGSIPAPAPVGDAQPA